MTNPHDMTIALDGLALPGLLGVPAGATGLVLFAHGSGSSRLSPRNGCVAAALREGGIGTLLFDLLTPDEDVDYARRFDIGLLTQRLVATTRWVGEQSELRDLALGYFGASTGSAAALKAAADLGEEITAVVSRGGRPDLAEAALPRVRAATLLIVGGHDDAVAALNRDAYARLRATKDIAIVPGATHLFEEPGALEAVARLATAWFRRHLGAARDEEQRAA
jgi:dienelactone hydrolase